MNSKVIITIICILVLIIGIIFCIKIFSKDKTTTNTQKEENSTINDVTTNTNNTNITNTSNTAVIYFSATGNTKKIAEYIKNTTNGDLLEIIPKEKYTDEDLAYNYDCRANREQQDNNARPEISNNIDTSKYDTIFLGYPIWWSDVPKIMLSFIDTNKLDGKNVILFCTSGSTDITQSENKLKSYNTNLNILGGKRFSSSTNQEEINTWIKEIKL